MNFKKHPRDHQSGSAMIIVVVVLVAITGLSLTMLNFTTQESKMAGHYKFAKQAFYNGDGGVYGTAKFIRLIRKLAEPIPEEDPGKAGCVTYLNTSGSDSADEIFNRLYGGFRGEEPDATESYNNLAAGIDDDPAAADLSMRGCQIPSDINIMYLGVLQSNLQGGGAEFGTSADGLASGGADVPIGFRLTSTGHDSQNNTHTIRAIYLWKDVAGGL